MKLSGNNYLEHTDDTGATAYLTDVNSNDHLALEIYPNDEYVNWSAEDVKSLINYLQNWVDTGDFEGKKEAESND